RVNGVLEMLDFMHHQHVPWLPTMDSGYGARLRIAWGEVLKDPQPFLSLGLSTEAWLHKALPILVAAEEQANLDREALIQNDVRSDNLCITSDRVVLVDWNLACRGNGDLDTAFWLPSLQAEGGPAPEEVVAIAAELTAVVSGFFAARAGLPFIPDAP